MAVLLEACRCGPGGEAQLAAATGCCQALLDMVASRATHPPGSSSNSSSAAATAAAMAGAGAAGAGAAGKGGGEGAAGTHPWWEDPHEAARAACTLLWRLSGDDEARAALLAGTTSLVQVLLGEWAVVGVVVWAGVDIKERLRPQAA